MCYLLYKRAQKSPNIWATFVRKFFKKNLFQSGHTVRLSEKIQFRVSVMASPSASDEKHIRITYALTTVYLHNLEAKDFIKKNV